MSIRYKKATLADIDEMQKLVKAEVDSGVILARSDDDIATNIRSYTLALMENELVGFVALHVHTKILAEIRSLVVKDGLRSRGIGKELVYQCISEGKKLGVKKILSLTYKQEFFQKLGFVEIPKESLPEHKIWADCIKCKHFPICNEVSLIKNL